MELVNTRRVQRLEASERSSPARHLGKGLMFGQQAGGLEGILRPARQTRGLQAQAQAWVRRAAPG